MTEDSDGYLEEDPFAATAGAYVLGALNPADRDAFQRHLRGCVDCRGAVEDLAGLPGLLSRVPPEVVTSLQDGEDPVLPVPDTVLPGLLREVRRRRVRRRTVFAGALVAASVVVGGAVASVVAREDTPAATPQAGSEPGPERSMDPLLPLPISATARLTPVGWGTQVDITCAYAEETASRPYPYALVVTDTEGTTEKIGSWTAIPGRDASLSGATAWTVDQIASVEIQTLSGTALLRLTES